MDPLQIFVLVGFGMATLALFKGIASMAQGGDANRQASHWLMFKRVGWQAAAVAFLLLALLGQLR